jgi:hypothetical protein
LSWCSSARIPVRILGRQNGECTFLDASHPVDDLSEGTIPWTDSVSNGHGNLIPRELLEAMTASLFHRPLRWDVSPIFLFFKFVNCAAVQDDRALAPVIAGISIPAFAHVRPVTAGAVGHNANIALNECRDPLLALRRLLA